MIKFAQLKFYLKNTNCKNFCTKLPSVPNGGHLSNSKNINKLITSTSKHLSNNNTKTFDDVKLDISHSCFETHQGNYVFNVSLNAVTKVVKPTVFVCALDVSGSMGGTSTYQMDPEASKFSRLDLVKHSMNTIIHCLRPEDTLAMISFSDNASKILSLSNMDEIGKKSAINSLKHLQPNGQTNLWDGLKMNLDEINTIGNNQNVNKFSLLLTDGEPNLNPPRGILEEFLNRNSKSPLISSLNTFGYGYGLDSDLLAKLSKYGGGLFAHIPDHTMCNTVFINFLSNCLATAIDKVDIKFDKIKHCNINKYNTNINNIINIGPIQSGQTQNITFQANINDPKDFEISMNFKYGDKNINYSIDKLKVNNSIKLNIDPNKDIFGSIYQQEQIQKILESNDMIYQIPKNMLTSIILEGMQTNDLKKVCYNLDVLYNFIENLKKIATKPMDIQKLESLLMNIKNSDINQGQIYKAFSKQEWYERWGIHYLKYFVRSHELQICSNFKDASLQLYGGKLFRELRTEIEDIFSQIPIPKPSLSSTPFTGNFQSSFYSPGGPCFDGKGIVTMWDKNTKLVEELKKGDKIINSEGKIATILCVIKTHIKNGNTDLVLYNGLRVTPWHPIKIGNKWNFPCKIKEPMKVHCDYIYNFVLDNHHIMTINNVDVITLGHNFTHDPILIHPFFGTNKVIENLKTKPGWHDGLIEISDYKPIYDNNGMIISF